MRRESLKVLWILLHLAVLSWQDLKNREIDLGPVWILGITGWVHSIWNGTGIWPWPGCFLLGMAVITGEQIGKGDGWVILALGMWFPAGVVERNLLGGMCLCGGTGLLLREKELPFVPFLTAAVLMDLWMEK